MTQEHPAHANLELPAMVEVGPDSMGSTHGWRTPHQVIRRLNPRSKVRFSFPPDKRHKIHQITVSLETGADGTLGVRIKGLDAKLIVQPLNGQEVYVTTLRPKS